MKKKVCCSQKHTGLLNKDAVTMSSRMCSFNDCRAVIGEFIHCCINLSRINNILQNNHRIGCGSQCRHCIHSLKGIGTLISSGVQYMSI